MLDGLVAYGFKEFGRVVGLRTVNSLIDVVLQLGCDLGIGVHDGDAPAGTGHATGPFMDTGGNINI